MYVMKSDCLRNFCQLRTVILTLLLGSAGSKTVGVVSLDIQMVKAPLALRVFQRILRKPRRTIVLVIFWR